MHKIKLVPVSKAYSEAVMAYKKEFILNEDSMDGTSGLRTCETFDEWEESLLKSTKEETVKEGHVPASAFLAVTEEDNRLVGMVNIRHRLSEYLLKVGGHIGYSVRKSERRQGFATQMLKLALKECQTLDIQKVLVTCDKDNMGSAKTIQKNRGVLESEVEEGERVVQRYWITL